MKWLLVLLFCLPVAAQTIAVGALFQAAPGLGYHTTGAASVEFESDHIVAEVTGGPLAKTTVAGGEYFTGGLQVSLWRGFGVGVGAAEEVSPLWRKTTVAPGPAYRYKRRYVEIVAAVSPHYFVTPNRGGGATFTVKYRQRHFLESITTGVEWFNQPFTNPQQHNLFGAVVTIGAAYVWGPR